MRKKFFYMLGVAATVSCFFSSSPAKAIVYNQFNSLERVNYSGGTFNIDANTKKKAIPPANFTVPPSTAMDLDNGYAKIPLGFKYRFNDKDYEYIWVSVNGFITFDAPKSSGNSEQEAKKLFSISASNPNEVLAPYWGDHHYWIESTENLEKGFAPTVISELDSTYQSSPGVTRKCKFIEWKNLNVNYRQKNTSTGVWDTLRGNVASFQVVIYQGANDVDSLQGDVDFRYNSNYGYPAEYISKYTGDPKALIPVVVPSSIGVKGSGYDNNHADFINAIYNGGEKPYDPYLQITSDTLSTMWTTTKETTFFLRFVARHSISDAETWGDGDADMSKAAGGKNVGKPQNQYVTINDVRTIMKSVVTGIPLERGYAKAAYHADVNHDGRYYNLTSNQVVTERMTRKDNDGNDVYIKDTFKIKAAVTTGNFGFFPYYGKNNRHLAIKFLPSNKEATVTISHPESPEDDYTLIVFKSTDTETDTSYFEGNVGTFEITLKKNINWVDPNIQDRISDLPGMSDYKRQIYWEANEADASRILGYLGGTTPMLPWIYDNIVYNGKIGIEDGIANNIKFDNIIKVDNNTYKVPVYLNGNGQFSSLISSKFNVSGEIVNFESANPDVLVSFSNDTKTAVVVGDGSFNSNTPLAYLTIKTDDNVLVARNVRFIGNDVENVQANLKATSVTTLNEFDILAQNVPNPVSNATTFTVTIKEAGSYKLMVSDILGNVVKTIANNYMTEGTTSYSWDCTNNFGEKVANGIYVYQLISDNGIITKRLIVNR